ncbi:MAG: threonine synthase [Gemmatimonadota bacterium]|nr:MAG: threonine synthase [Gemmatimonadota bacterium]
MEGELVCEACGARYSLDASLWRCECEGLLDIEFESRFDLERIGARPRTMWRYREAIPIGDDPQIVSFGEGFTPLTRIDIDGKQVWFKQDHLFPSGSYKDRGASVLVSKLKELGISRVVEDSSGNAGASIAAYCAKAGIGCHILVPEGTSAGKLTQVRLYGAELTEVPGSREDTARATLQEAAATYYASHVWNPFFFHGTKTFAFEVCEQLGWRPPDTVLVPVGNGTLLLGAYLGFTELLRAGVIERVPRLVAVQAENCAPLYRAFTESLEEIPSIETSETLADGIAIAEPVRGRQIVRAVLDSGGSFLTVSETEMLESLAMMCAKGFYIEPTSAAAVAGVRRYLGHVDDQETIVSVLTGHGLKATEKMAKVMPQMLE